MKEEALAHWRAVSPPKKIGRRELELRVLIRFFCIQTPDGLRFEWDEYEQNMILGCFFWGYVLTELPGGRMAEIIGGHRVFGYSMLSASVLTLLTPLAARLDYLAVVVLRVLLGLMLVIYS